MNDWWNALTFFDQTIWLITIPVSVIFVLQMILTFLGMDANGDLDADFDGDMNSDLGDAPFQLFTFRNFINFLLGFGWTVICFENVLPNQGLLILLGVTVGCALVAAVMYIFVSMTKLSQQGNMVINNALNQTAEVYLTIPEKKTGSGKVHIRVQGTLRELDAITLGERIPTGSQVKVLSITKNNLLLVSLA